MYALYAYVYTYIMYICYCIDSILKHKNVKECNILNLILVYLFTEQKSLYFVIALLFHKTFI